MINDTLLKIQTELVAPKNQFNKFGKYKYRSCEDILEAIKPFLKETRSNLIISDEVVQLGDRYYVKATATLVTKEDQNVSATAYARESEGRKGMDDSQLTGATSSYARKYALNGLFCIDDTKDADTQNGHQEKTTVSMPSEVQTQVKTTPKTAVNAPVSNENAQSNGISKESAQSLVNLAKMKGYTQDEYNEIIFTLGYTKTVEILQQDYTTILESLSKPAEEYRKNQAKTEEEAWNESETQV